MEYKESLLEFPCTFPLKAIGKNTESFERYVKWVVQENVPGLDEDAFSRRTSRGDKYVSVSVTFMAESRSQVDSIYTALSKHEHVILLL